LIFAVITAEVRSGVSHSLKNPSLRNHVASGRAVVTVKLRDASRRDFYCGVYGSAAARNEYKRILEVLLANDGVYPTANRELTIVEALLAYDDFAVQSARRELHTIRKAIKSIRELYGSEPTHSFGPKALKLVQQKWIDDGLSRKGCNRLLSAVKRYWRWIVSEELIPAENLAALQAVEGLWMGKTVAPELPPVRPANPDDLEKVIPHRLPLVAAVVKLQSLTGARCGELLCLKAAELDRTGTI